MENKCAICESGTTIMNRRKIANDEVICQKCLQRATSLTFKQMLRLKNVKSDEIRKAISETAGEEVLNFKPDESIGKIEFDYESGKMLVPGILNSFTIINFKDIGSFELIEDGEAITKGGIKRAIIGGALFGDAGAVVGALTANKKKEYCDSLQVQITEKDKTKPIVRVSYINKRTKVGGFEHDTAVTMANFLMAKLQEVCNEHQDADAEEEKTLSAIEEIKQYKELLNADIITQKEFDKKKKELLNL